MQYEKREQMRSDLTEEELKELTFKPRTGRAPQVSFRSPRSIPVEDRLHMEGKQRNEMREKMRAAVENAEINACTFRPAITTLVRIFKDSNYLDGANNNLSLQLKPMNFGSGRNTI